MISYFDLANIAVIITFVFISFELLYSLLMKDNVHTLRGTVGNLMNAFVMKFLLGNLGIFTYVGYLVFIEKKIPNIENIQNFGILSFILCVVLVDFTSYWYHRAHHHFRLLWTMHFIHHSDDKFNLSTSYRISWVEKTYNLIVIVPAVFFGFNPYFAILAFYFCSIYQVFIHSQYIKYPKLVGLLLITPQSHMIHHLQEYERRGMNFGIVFSVWDRIFGTYSERVNERKFGIVNYSQDHFLMMQIDPLVEYFKELKSKVSKRLP